MKIDFDHMERSAVYGLKGGEGTMLTRNMETEEVKIADNVLEPGASIGYHCHESGWEAMYFMEGTFLVNYDGEETVYEAGMAHLCPNGHSHSCKNIGETPARFLAVIQK
ncbi:MAG: cupin domain-containing protein [Clostridia bacterium]|nr:cupin domain-containing protein [Clostridia bacterium]